MEYSLTTRYTPKHGGDIGHIKVTIEGHGEGGSQLKPGMILMNAAMAVMLSKIAELPGDALYWDGVLGNEPCEFVSFDPATDHLTIRLKK
jgi:hypothetical protein